MDDLSRKNEKNNKRNKNKSLENLFDEFIKLKEENKELKEIQDLDIQRRKSKNIVKIGTPVRKYQNSERIGKNEYIQVSRMNKTFSGFK